MFKFTLIIQGKSPLDVGRKQIEDKKDEFDDFLFNNFYFNTLAHSWKDNKHLHKPIIINLMKL